MIGYTGIPLFEMMQNDPPHGWFLGFSLLLGIHRELCLNHH